MPQFQFGYAYHDTENESFNRHLDLEAKACADALARSERGTKALQVISDWLANGGIGLDASNQRAALTLLAIAWRRPSAADNAITNAIH